MTSAGQRQALLTPTLPGNKGEPSASARHKETKSACCPRPQYALWLLSATPSPPRWTNKLGEAPGGQARARLPRGRNGKTSQRRPLSCCTARLCGPGSKAQQAEKESVRRPCGFYPLCRTSRTGRVPAWLLAVAASGTCQGEGEAALVKTCGVRQHKGQSQLGGLADALPGRTGREGAADPDLAWTRAGLFLGSLMGHTVHAPRRVLPALTDCSPSSRCPFLPCFLPEGLSESFLAAASRCYPSDTSTPWSSARGSEPAG